MCVDCILSWLCLYVCIYLYLFGFVLFIVLVFVFVLCVELLLQVVWYVFDLLLGDIWIVFVFVFIVFVFVVYWWMWLVWLDFVMVCEWVIDFIGGCFNICVCELYSVIIGLFVCMLNVLVMCMEWLIVV